MYAVGGTALHRESAQVARDLIAQVRQQQQIARDQLTVHAERDSGVTSTLVALLMADLDVLRSHNRPDTSTHNPYLEGEFKALKYRPGFPARFDSIAHARTLCRLFFDWYDHQHRHRGISLMTPAGVHQGQAERLHADRARVLFAYAASPERFVRHPPRPPALPSADWINKPDNEGAAH